MGSTGCAETSVRNYYSLRNDPEERSSQVLRVGSLKWQTSNKTHSAQFYFLIFKMNAHNSAQL
jgi:hypothetical protein